MGGVDKPLLSLAGRTILDHLLERLRPQAIPIALSANGDPLRFEDLGLLVLPDPWPGQPGPLAGVLAGMLWARNFASHVLSCPGDTPFLPADLTAQLSRAAAEGPACAASAGRVHPTVALWPVALAEELAGHLRGGRYRVVEFAEAAGAVFVEWPGCPDPFFNINTPHDLRLAAERVAHPGQA